MVRSRFSFKGKLIGLFIFESSHFRELYTAQNKRKTQVPCVVGICSFFANSLLDIHPVLALVCNLFDSLLNQTQFKTRSTKGRTMAAKKASTSKTTSTTKAAAKKGAVSSKPAAEKKAPVERDAFGNKVGTQVARINAALSNSPQSAKEIAEVAKANPTATASHLHTLMTKELIERKDGGYILKAAPKKTTRKRSSK